jgi:hypothetical protein
MGERMKIPKPKTVSRQYLEKKLDKALFEYLKATTGPYCHLAGHGCKCGGPLQPNHLISRSVKRLRWDEENVIVACAGHNTWAHFNQVEWDHLWRELWPYRAKSLDLKRQGTMKVNPGVLMLMIADFEMRTDMATEKPKRKSPRGPCPECGQTVKSCHCQEEQERRKARELEDLKKSEELLGRMV